MVEPYTEYDTEYDTENYTPDIIEEIDSEGMIFIAKSWMPIDCTVQVYRETEKAYYGNITVHECNNMGRVDELWSMIHWSMICWIPKSMSTNVWFICTKIFNHPDKVSNRRFDGYE